MARKNWTEEQARHDASVRGLKTSSTADQSAHDKNEFNVLFTRMFLNRASKEDGWLVVTYTDKDEKAIAMGVLRGMGFNTNNGSEVSVHGKTIQINLVHAREVCQNANLEHPVLRGLGESHGEGAEIVR